MIAADDCGDRALFFYDIIPHRHNAMQDEGGGIDSISPLVHGPSTSLRISGIGIIVYGDIVTAGRRILRDNGSGFCQGIDRSKPHKQEEYGQQNQHEQDLCFFSDHDGDTGKDSRVLQQCEEDQQRIFDLQADIFPDGKSQQKRAGQKRDEKISNCLQYTRCQDDDKMGQIDDGASLSGDNLVAERTVQKFTADKKDALYGEGDTDPDDNIVKIDIEISCHVIARHDGGKERP